MVQALDVFPEGVNVSFMEIETANTVKLRVFERGVGEDIGLRIRRLRRRGARHPAGTIINQRDSDTARG